MPDDDILEKPFPGRRSALKRNILENALACFNELGVEATTIDTIKVRCGASVGAIYHHFGNKEGILSALFFCAQDNQRAKLTSALETAKTLKEAVHVIVKSYVDWVTSYPEWARFLFQARSAVAKGPHQQQLRERNIENYRELREVLFRLDSGANEIIQCQELLPSLIIGPAENFCRAWLSGRIQTSPLEYREQLAESAWRSIHR